MEILYGIRFYLLFFAACAALTLLFIKIKDGSEKRIMADNTKAALDESGGDRNLQ